MTNSDKMFFSPPYIPYIKEGLVRNVAKNKDENDNGFLHFEPEFQGIRAAKIK